MPHYARLCCKCEHLFPKFKTDQAFKRRTLRTGILKKKCFNDNFSTEGLFVLRANTPTRTKFHQIYICRFLPNIVPYYMNCKLTELPLNGPTNERFWDFECTRYVKALLSRSSCSISVKSFVKGTLFDFTT